MGLQHDLARSRLEFVTQYFHQGGLATAIGTDQAISVAVVEFGRNIFKKGFCPKLYSEVSGRNHKWRVSLQKNEARILPILKTRLIGTLAT